MILDRPFPHRALLTGASGFVGGRLRTALLEAGSDVLAIIRPTSRVPEEGRSVRANYTDQAALGRILAEEKPDYVFHVAGVTKGVTYEDFRLGNVMPTRNLLAAARHHHPDLKRFVLVSSLAAYGPSTPSRPLEETDPPRPIEHYGTSKLEAERVLESEGGEVPWTILRPSGVYGPGDVDYFNLFREASSGRNTYFGNRQRWFSAVYVDDCVRALVEAALSPQARGRGYFVDDGVPVTWEVFQKTVCNAAGRRVFTFDLPEFVVSLAALGGEALTRLDGKPRLLNRQKAKMGAQAAWTCSSEAAHRDFGWSARVPLARGIEESFAWYRRQNWMPSASAASRGQN
ncbi:MAG: NAD(P)-dependent oxidoreductase [Myxococcota bacterium]